MSWSPKSSSPVAPSGRDAEAADREPRVRARAGARPSTPVRAVGVGAAVGFLLTVVWSAPLVDTTVGGSVARDLLGHDPRLPIDGLLAGAGFALASGLAGSFTACNIAAFGTLGPMLEADARPGTRVRVLARTLGLLVAGMLAVSAPYGALVGLLGTRMPQFSTARAQPGTITPGLVQSMVVFGLIGLAMIYLALTAVRLAPDPLAAVETRLPGSRTVLLGAMMGAFLIGRPYPLFRQIFRDAAQRHDPLYGALAFCLQSIGNTVVLAVLLSAVLLLGRHRSLRATAHGSQRMVTLSALTLTASGVFLVLYWDVRLLAVLQVIPWYPLAPWV